MIIVLACKYGWLEIASMLLDAGYAFNPDIIAGACFYGHFELVKLLIHKMDLDYSLGLATRGGHIEIVKLLLDK